MVLTFGYFLSFVPIRKIFRFSDFFKWILSFMYREGAFLMHNVPQTLPLLKLVSFGKMPDWEQRCPEADFQTVCTSTCAKTALRLSFEGCSWPWTLREPAVGPGRYLVWGFFWTFGTTMDIYNKGRNYIREMDC